MQPITDIQQLNLDGNYTYADYLTWRFEERLELIKGKVFRMSPAPTSKHQMVSGNLQGLIWGFFQNKTCKLFSAPFDVRLLDKKKSTEDKDITTVVQPDLCLLCDMDKLDGRGCVGAPDWIIEIVSPSTSKKDVGVKYELYESNGVREYWIAHPLEEYVETYWLNEHDKFEKGPVFGAEDVAVPHLFPTLNIDLKIVFE